MATNHHHHQCHCQPSRLTTTPYATTCYCTMCCTTTHCSSQPPPHLDPLVHSISSHLHQHPPPQPYLYEPPHENHILQTQHYDYYPPPPPPPQTHRKHQLFRKYRQQEDAREKPPPINPTVSSLINRIAALESSLRRRNRPPGSSSLRDAAARTIQTHFREFLVRRSKTLRHLKDLAYIKSALNNLKSSVSGKTHFDSQLLSLESMNLLIKLDSIQGSDPMIRDGKRSISRELIRFMEFIDEMSTETRLISVKNVRFGKKGKKSVVLQREHKIRASGSRVLADDERKLPENLKNQVKKSNRFSTSSKDEHETENLEHENPRKHGLPQTRIGAFLKSQAKGKKNVSFAENGNVYRVIRSNHSPVSSDDSDSSNGDEGVEEIGVPSKETEVHEEDSSEISDNEMNPRNNLGTRTDHTPEKNQPDQEEDDDDDDEDDDDDSFVFSAPLPAKMEYRVNSVNKKQTVKQ